LRTWHLKAARKAADVIHEAVRRGGGGGGLLRKVVSAFILRTPSLLASSSANMLLHEEGALCWPLHALCLVAVVAALMTASLLLGAQVSAATMPLWGAVFSLAAVEHVLVEESLSLWLQWVTCNANENHLCKYI
jgi:hypothetical protein